MTLVSNCSDGQIKIRVFGAPSSVPRVKVDENYQVAQVWCRNMKNVFLGWFWPAFTFDQPKFD